MDAGGIVIAAVNMILAFGCGWPWATMLSRLQARPASRVRTFAVLFAVYACEVAAFAASMGTNVLNVGLAFIWGFVLGAWLPSSAIPAAAWRRIALRLAIYTTLPALSFLSVPIVAFLGGWPVLDPAAGARFGVPEFLPWPLNTILGLSVLVTSVAVVGKVPVTATVAGMVARRRVNVLSRTHGEASG